MTGMSQPDLRIENLSINYSLDQSELHAVRNVCLEVRPGEVVGIVGESGSGKSTLGYAVLGALDENGYVANGRILFGGRDITKLSRAGQLQLRGSQIALVPQDPPTALNPTMSVGEQIAEVLRHHENLSNEAARARTLSLIREVHLPNPEQLYNRYPFELSGGQQQRIVIAMAFACRPRLLIMDEPTTGLDVTSEARVLQLLRVMIKEYGTSVLYISHNLGTIVNICQRVVVMYAGEVVEEIAADSLMRGAKHPYTIGLLGCIPTFKRNGDLQTIGGELPNLLNVPTGCVFSTRCPYATEDCRQNHPDLENLQEGATVRCWRHRQIDATAGRPVDAVAPLPAQRLSKDIVLRVEDLASHYTIRRSIFDVILRRPPKMVKAVDSISFEVERGSTFALVGESGCGKTTLGRTLLGLSPASRGRIVYDGEVLSPRLSSRPKRLRREIQAIFQNPEQTLNPKKTLERILSRPLSLAGRDSSSAAVAELLRSVRIPIEARTKYPRQLSGGQKQRVAIARAFATGPKFIVCDEPLSALDVSVQAAIVNLLADLQIQAGTTYVFISHDLPLVAHFAHKIAVMYLGKICEVGNPEQLLAPPYHPYTEALLSSVPLVDPSIAQRRVVLEGPVSAGSGKGCVFAARCPRKIGRICEEQAPQVRDFGVGHQIACHISREDLLAVPPVFGFGHGDDSLSPSRETSSPPRRKDEKGLRVI
ncbi:ABC transporter ATP-binding protein [Bradyrhizobium sp. 166]|uniref:dipeptide ABC transporter ATP-binding protein n=1 Tax=Bradyrhizobium sp. 166 TaxID=2782638 RepID=UPI001FFC0922|nr:ABC transporter ATP-binding protein [Bradyrhizobium sp. 166]MCK1604777.1 ABC transporter ATP-binding protein [Bradyrhizobium sp. 166]